MAANGSPRSNVYTVLALIALLSLLTAVGYLWVRSETLFGPGSQFTVKSVSVILDPLRAILRFA